MANPSVPSADGSHLPIVQLELRHGKARPAVHQVADASFVIGTVAGCDLRLPAAGLPPVVAMISRQADGVLLRKLAPAQAILHNGEATSASWLSHGDRLTIGPVELICHIAMPERLPLETSVDAEAVRQFHDQRRQLEDQARELEADRVLWYQRKAELERECEELRQTLADTGRDHEDRDRDLSHLSADLEQREEALEQQREGLTQLQRDLEAREERLTRQKQEVETVRQELNTVRQQLYDRYRERRDRLAGLQEAVNHAARKVQERKREVEETTQANLVKDQELAARAAQLQQLAEEVAQARLQVEEREHEVEQHKQELSQSWSELQARQQKLEEDEQALAASQAQHQSDLVRLDRLAAHLEIRQKQLQDRALEIDNRAEEQARTSRDLEEQAAELDAWQERLTQETESLAQQRVELEARLAELAPRAAALESQQAMLATLRTRVEKMREDVRREAQWLAEQRERHEQAELELQGRLEEEQGLRHELTAERQAFEAQRLQFEERSAMLEQALGQLRQVEQKLADQDADLKRREEALASRGVEQDEQFGVLQTRTAQLTELQHRLEADRAALKEREEALARAEQAREALQEQLRKRSEDLNARQKALADQIRQHEEATAQIQAELEAASSRRADLEQEEKRLLERVEERGREVEKRQAELEAWNRKLEIASLKVKEEQAEASAARQALEEERARWQAEQEQVLTAAQKSQAELEASRQEALDLQRQLPELELQARESADRLTTAREQLREHLAELHRYAQQGQEDLQTLRGQIAAEADQVRVQEQGLHKARHEHRLAVAAFRQQLIEWQGQITSMKRTLASGETRLQFRQAEVDEKAKKIDLTSARLARQAEELSEQQRVVARRRGQVEKHLVDMQEWYRVKLRELAENQERDAAGGEPAESNGHAAAVRTERNVLAMTTEIDAGDRKLGELLGTLELVDAETLDALLVEARRQKRSLRHVLLATGCLTFYQLALIEAGNVDALMLGPTRVVDRLRVTSKEAVFRVFDPRRGQEGVLRHLAEAEAGVAGRADDFRLRFSQAAAVQHPHVAASYEVFDVAGRPAVLQETATGLASCDWPALAAVAGVWYRLLNQAAVGLQAIHQAGLVHGHLDAGLILLTADGTVKLCGLGEPAWLTDHGDPSDDPATDLVALGRIAAGWSVAGRTRGSRARPLPESLQAILYGLQSAGDDRLPDAAALLAALDQASGDVPPNPEAWDRLLRHVRDQVAVDSQLRLSA